MSKMGIISLAIVLTIYTLVVLMRKSWKTGLSLILIMFTLFFFSITYKESPLRTRFEAISSALSNLKTENNPSTESNAARIIMWNTSLQVIGQYWLIGTGTGDYNEILTNLNKKLNNTGVTEEQLNSHNQFLNTWVQLGIFGLFVLVMLFVSSFFQNGRNLFGILILSTFLINFLVESFLETQSGIILFCILSVILFRESKEQQVQSTENS
jgi:O-antigen ligase